MLRRKVSLGISSFQISLYLNMAKAYFLVNLLAITISTIKTRPITSDITETTYSAVPLGTKDTRKIELSVMNIAILKKSLRKPEFMRA